MGFRDELEAAEAQEAALRARLEDAQAELASLRVSEVGALRDRVAELEAKNGRLWVGALLAVVVAIAGTWALVPESGPRVVEVGRLEAPAEPARSEDIPYDDLVRYFSGATVPLNNFPAVILSRDATELWVIGYRVDERFPASDVSAALEAYRELLIARRYEVPGGPSHAGETVVDIVGAIAPEMDVDESGLSPAQLAPFGTPAEAWAILASGAESGSGRLLMYAHSGGITVRDPPREETIPLARFDEAMAFFVRRIDAHAASASRAQPAAAQDRARGATPPADP